uniref:hypothetical protein n=1 Tax=Salmonella enterica TaxID=28901 RepID=UPI003296EF89
NANFALARDVSRESPRLVLSPVMRRFACAFAATVFAIAFVLPVIQLAIWAYENIGDLDVRYIGFVSRSLLLAAS